MVHSIKYIGKTSKTLFTLPGDAQKHILRAITKLADNPRPAGCKKLKGVDAYRIRIGDYRVIYEVRDELLLVLVIRVGHRQDIYRD